MLLATTLSAPLSKQTRLSFHQIQFFLYRSFLYSKLDHTICPDQAYVRISFS